MAVEERRSPRELDEILTRAVERQIAEQRALREALTELRQSVQALAARPQQPPTVDLSSVDERIRRTIEDTSAFLVAQFRELRETLGPQIEGASSAGQAVRDVAGEVTTLRVDVGDVAADIDGIARSLVELNAGLRGWAEGLERTVTNLRDAIERIREVATRPVVDESPPAGRAEPVEIIPAQGPHLDELALTARVVGVENRLKQAGDLSLYLTDQIQDLDRVMTRMSELPTKLEGVVSQALRRAMAARAKLDRDAETALDDALGTLDEHVEQLEVVLSSVANPDEQLRKITLGQVELTSRLETLQDAFLDRLETIDAERRQGEEALARAIDRSARGLDPRAAESLAKRTKPTRRKGAATKKAAAKKPTAAKTRSAAKSDQRVRGSSSAKSLRSPNLTTKKSSGTKKKPSQAAARRARRTATSPDRDTDETTQ